MYATRNALQGRVGSTSAMSPAGFEPLEARTLLSVDFVSAVINAKYKAEKGAGFPNAALYQMLAYCTALRLPVGHLVYA